MNTATTTTAPKKAHATKSIQQDHFVTETILSSALLATLTLILLLSIWYYWYHHTHINSSFDENYKNI